MPFFKFLLINLISKLIISHVIINFQKSDFKMKEKYDELIPNPFPIPDLSKEGYWYNGYYPKLDKNVKWRRGWHHNLDPHRRLFSHQTLSSARKNWFYVPGEHVCTVFNFKRKLKIGE